MKTVSISNVTRNCELAHTVEVAAGIYRRTRGLLGRSGLDAGAGLMLVPCHWVHTLAMRFPIDVVYVDPDDTVLHTESLARNRMGRPVRGSRYVIELPVGSLAATGTKIGDKLRLIGINPSCSA